MDNENEDVMGFNTDEPDIKPEDSYIEPDIPDEQNPPNLDEAPQGESSEMYAKMYEGYEDFEAMNPSDLPGGDINSSNYGQPESNGTDNEGSETDSDSEEEQSQAKKIMDTKPSEKSESKKNKNNGVFLARGKILLIIAAVFVAFILFFTFVYPHISSKKKKDKESELEKNGKTYIPSGLNTNPDYYNQTNNQFEDGNSAVEKEYPPELTEQNLDEKYPPIVNNEEPQKNVAPVSLNTGSSSTSEVPLTNRNEQQKQPQRLSLERVTSPTEAQNKKSGSNYPTVKPEGYTTGYNSGYTGTSTQATGYTPQNLSSNLDRYFAQQAGGNLGSSYAQQNNQSAKQEFLNKNGIGGQYRWNDEFSLWKGTVITAVLDTGINTDLPGQVMAHVSKNVYSSQDGRYLLIPQGSRLFGEYSSDVSYGQNRVQVVWNTLIRPDGLEVNLGSMNGINAYGASGYAGFKTEHPFEYLKAFGLIALYSILDTKAMNLIDTTNNTYAQNAMTDVYSETKRLNNKIVDRALDIQPTIRIASGTEVNLITNVTIDLPPLEAYEVTEKYVRY